MHENFQKRALEFQIGARVGDSIVVTEDGFEYLTPNEKELRIL